MASQAFAVDTGENKAVSLPQGEATELSFNTSEVAGMKLSDGGELTISFRDGGSLTINNFRELAESDVQIALEDGDTINSKSLFDTLAADLAPVTLDLPQPGETVAYNVEAGRKYEINVNEPVAEVSQQEDALLITFNDGGQLVLRNFQDAVQADDTTEVSVDGEFMTLREFADGLQLAEMIDGNMQEEVEVIQSEADIRTGDEQLAQLAQELSDIEPAAGEGAGGGNRGGFGFQSQVRSAPLNAPDAIGPIGPTALQFGLPEFQDELYYVEEQGPTPPGAPGVEFADEVVYEDGSVLIDVFAQSNSTDPSVTMTVTISGIPSTWGVDPNGGTYNAATGTWTGNVTGSTFAGGPILSPPADSDADLPNLVVRATNTDSSTGLTSSSAGTLAVTTDAVADTPDIAATDSVANEDTPADLNITTAVTDTDGSEEITSVVISNVPAGFALSAGTETTPGTWVLTQAELAGLQITAPADYFGTITLDVTTTAEEVNKSDTDFDFTNDTATNSTQFDVTWQPVIDPPSIEVNGGVDEVQVKEDGTVDVTLEAALNPVDSADAFITVTVTGFDPAWGTVTAPVGTFNAAGTEWTITMPAGTDLSTVFTFTPAAESDIDLTGLTATVVATEPATSTTASASDDFYITVDAVADDPSITANGDTDVEGSVLDVDVQGMLGSDTDGSEQITGYQISGVPAEVTFSAGTNLGGGVWSFTPAEIAGLQATHADGDFDGSINLTATVFTTENPVSDGEFDTTDNNNQASDGFTLTWTPDIDPPTIKVNGGVPDVQVKEDGTVDVALEVNLDADAEPSEYLTVEITGFDPAWGTVTAPIGTFSPDGTTWTVTMPAGTDLSTVFTFTPVAESDIDLTNLQITATATDPVEGISADATDSFNVIVDAVADAPSIDAKGDTDVEGSILDVDVQGMLGTDTDGSEQITGYQISGVPAEVTFSAGTDLGGGVWGFTPAEIVGLTATHADGNFNGSINLTATVFTTENPVSDGEFDTTDNNNQASDGLTLTWTPDIDPPTIKVNGGVPDVQVKEDGTVDVALEVKLDADAEPSEYLTVEITGFDPAWGTVTNGEGTFSPDGTTWTITMPAGTDLSTVFTFTPAAESDIDLTNLQITATATDPVEGLSADATDSFNVIVDAVADDPSIDAKGDTDVEGATLDVDIQGMLGSDTDGSEQITGYQISGVPAGVTFSAGTNIGGGVWSFTPAEIVGLTATHSNSNFNGSINLTATVFTTENPVSDGEFDTTDNNNSASDSFKLKWTPEIDPPSIKVNGGVPDVQVKEDGSVDVRVEVDLAPSADTDEYLTVEITGFDPAWGVVTNGEGTFSPDGTTWTITLPAGADLDTVFSFSPAAESDIDLTGLQVTATATDPSAGLSADATDSFDVIVDAVADDPSLNATGGSKEEGNPIDITLNGSLGSDTDGSEMITGYQISGVPAGFTFNQGTNQGGGVWSFTVAETAGLQIISTDPTYAGSLNLTATVFTTENPVSDGEFDYTDNNNSASDKLKVTWEDDDEPEVKDDEVSVDETDLAPTTSVSGKITADFGDDAPGSFSANGGFFSGVALTSNGAAVNVTLVGNTYTGATAGGETIFTLVVQSNGDYTFTLSGTLDHPDTADHNDDFALEFGVTATDSDSDVGTGTIIVNVFDDGLKANDDFNTVDEDIGFTTGNVVTGENGGAGAADDLSNDQPNNVTKVTFDGVDYDVPATGSVTVNGDFGALEISADGSYTYTLFSAGGGAGTGGTVQHTFAGNPGEFPDMNESQALDPSEQQAIGITQGDLNVVEGSEITLTYVGEGAGYNNTLGAFTVAADGTIQTGSVLMPNVTGTASGTQFGYTAGADAASAGFFIIADGADINGNYAGIDFSTGSVEFIYGYGTGSERAAKISDSGSDITLVYNDGAGNETVLNGPVYYSTTDTNGGLNPDGKVHVVSDLANEADNTVLRIGFEDLPKLGDKDYNDVYFDVSITSPDDCGCDTCGADQFEYTLTDADNDTSTATLTLECLEDDTPIITKIEHKAVDETDMAPTTDVSGVITADFGTDAPGSFSANGSFTQPAGLTSNGEPVTISLSGNTYTGSTASGDVFTMEIKADGSYTFTLLDTIDHPDTDDHNDVLSFQFGVKATDSDDDYAEGMVTINVFDDGLTAHDDCNVFDVVSVDKDYNVALMLDVSGSMGGSKLDLLKASVKNVLADYNAYQGGEIKVFISPFSTDTQTGYTFTVTNDAEYQQALAMIDGMSANGFTNYEAPLTSAINWLQSGDTISGADTYSYFISDGEPNRYLNNSGQVVSGSRSDVLKEIQGISDATNEVATLKSLSTEVIGVGIGVNSTTLAVLDLIDSDGNALDVKDASDLDAALKGTSFFGTAYGNVITGENGGFGAADNLSNDMDNTVVKVSFGGTEYVVDPVTGASIDGDFGTLQINADGSYTYKLNASGLSTGETHSLSPVSADANGTQESITKDGITISVANSGDFDIKWVSTADGNGLGIDNLNSSDSTKVWPQGEAFDVSFADKASNVEITIAELGDNNDDGYHGVDYIVTLADGSTVNGEQQFVPSEIVDGYFTFELDAADYGQQITGVELFSTNAGSYKGASFLLNNIEYTTETTSNPKDVFEYTLMDADGDTSTAYLKLQGTFTPVIAGTTGDDLMVGTTGEDILFGDTGADVFLFDNLGAVDTVLDFDMSEGDQLDLSALISDYDPLQDSINDFVFATESHGSTTISVDVSGSGNAADAIAVVNLEGVTGLSIDDLNSGNLIA